MSSQTHFWNRAEHTELEEHAKRVSQLHLRSLLQDEARNDRLFAEFDGLTVDATRQCIDSKALDSLFALFQHTGSWNQVQQLFAGAKINSTEGRAVLHPALRCAKTDTFQVGGKDMVKEVLDVQQKISDFAGAVREGKRRGHSGKLLTDVVCIGIGGSYLGVEFVFEALRTHTKSAKAAEGRKLHFLANVDPIDSVRALDGFDLDSTLVIIISKTFTTAETMMNARLVKERILKHFNNDQSCIGKHFCAVSTNLKATGDFGIAPENVFGFWDWVGGRFSVCSAVGVLPLALQYGFEAVDEFLGGARAMDSHFRSTHEVSKNLPVLMGLLSFWNSTYLRHNCVAVLPYCQGLLRFPAHIQQLTMESNGKRVCLDGTDLPSSDYSGEIYFGEPGTNGQHSFYQLIHQGRVVPCEFIGFTKSQQPLCLAGQSVTNHDELMSNFFAQPDALALGKTPEQLKQEGVPAELISHKTFPGNRPSTCLLFEGELTPYRVGQLLALYEHRTAIEGFMWGVNSFDQWGVELGKSLAKQIRNVMETKRSGKDAQGQTSALVSPTQRLLAKYFSA